MSNLLKILWSHDKPVASGKQLVSHNLTAIMGKPNFYFTPDSPPCQVILNG